jgi:hypothetical protein
MRALRAYNIGALDCETDGLDGPLLYTSAFDEVTGELFEAPHKTGTKNFLKYVLYQFDRKKLKNLIWYSHNGEYDWRYMVSTFKEFSSEFEIVPSERAHGKLYQLEIKQDGKRITRFRDSMAIFPRKLKEFAAAFSPDIPKGEIDWEKERFDRHNPVHIEYARNDVRCLVASIKNYDAFIYEHFSIHLSATSSGTAFQGWRRTISKDYAHWRLTPRQEEYMRETYVGGMVQLNAEYLKSYPNVTSYDINSSYPASMRKGVPIGKPSRTLRFEPGSVGYYQINVRCRDDFILPVIAHKSPKGLSFPTGQFSTFATSIEIEYALSLGYDIEILDGYVFKDGLGFIFDAYVDKCEALRARFKGQPTEFVIKQMQNSLYGRFGMKPEGREIKVDFEGDGPEDFQTVFDTTTGETIPYLYYRDVERSTEYMLPHWASWITAQSRILLDKGARAVGVENVLYRDTDSLYVKEGTPVENLDIGAIYGQFKIEGHFDEMRVHAPKFYSTVKDGVISGKCKGIPKRELTPEIWEKFHAGELISVGYHQSNSFLTAMKDGVFGTERTRHQTQVQNIYSHELVDGKFRPRKINDTQPTPGLHPIEVRSPLPAEGRLTRLVA